MKKGVLSFPLFYCTALCLHAETANTNEDYPIIDEITFDATTQTELVYSNDFNNLGYNHLTTSFPIADHLYISGTHIEFTLSEETIRMFLKHYKNETTTILDLDLHFYKGDNTDTTNGSVHILRINFLH